jgi:hypothetical protein
MKSVNLNFLETSGPLQACKLGCFTFLLHKSGTGSISILPTNQSQCFNSTNCCYANESVTDALFFNIAPLTAAATVKTRDNFVFHRRLENTSLLHQPHNGSILAFSSQVVSAPSMQEAGENQCVPKLYSMMGGFNVSQQKFAEVPRPLFRVRWVTDIEENHTLLRRPGHSPCPQKHITPYIQSTPVFPTGSTP